MLVSEERLECIPRWGSSQKKTPLRMFCDACERGEARIHPSMGLQPKKTPLRMFCDACERGEARMHPSMGLSTKKENTLADVL